MFTIVAQAEVQKMQVEDGSLDFVKGMRMTAYDSKVRDFAGISSKSATGRSSLYHMNLVIAIWDLLEPTTASLDLTIL